MTLLKYAHSHTHTHMAEVPYTQLNGNKPEPTNGIYELDETECEREIDTHKASHKIHVDILLHSEIDLFVKSAVVQIAPNIGKSKIPTGAHVIVGDTMATVVMTVVEVESKQK